MSFDVTVFSASAVAASVAAALVSSVARHLGQKLYERNLRELQTGAQSKLEHILLQAANGPHADGDHGGDSELPPEVLVGSKILKSIENGIVEDVTSRIGLQPGQSSDEVARQIDEVRKKVESIEKRFPHDATLDKYASVNDALLSQRLEQLSTRINTLEKKILSKWDVALIVSMVIGGVFAVVGATYAVLKALGHAT